MKKCLCAMLVAFCGFSLWALEIPIENKTPFKIVKIEITDFIDDDFKEVMTVNIPAKSTRRIKFASKCAKADTLTIHFSNDEEYECIAAGYLADVTKITLTYDSEDEEFDDNIEEEEDEE